jgi:DNA-binding NarL/FixJ family response regulator
VTESKNITTVLIDDHKMFRQGIQLLLEREGIGIVGHAENGHEGLSIVEQLRPSLALLDVNLPLLNGIELASVLRKECPLTGLIMLTAYRDHHYVVRALRAGAIGYVWKGADFSELVVAINAVSQGHAFISPAVSNEILSGYLKNETGVSTKVDVLTPRQRQVLQLIAEGRSNKEIAALLSLSVKGVEKHRSDLMKRLDLHNTAELVMYAVQSGLAWAA